MKRDRFEPSEGFENKDRGTLWWRMSHWSDTHLHILRAQCPLNGSILSAVLVINHVIRAEIRLCIHVIESDGVFMLFTSRIDCTSDLQVRIHTYTRCLSHIRVATHVRPGAVWQREKYIYLKTVSQLSQFVKSVLFTDTYSIIIILTFLVLWSASRTAQSRQDVRQLTS